MATVPPLGIPVHLIQQYYIPSDETRCAEVKKCLSQNISNPEISKIHLLNERDYAPNDLQASDKIIQTVLGKRLTYEDVFRYASSITERCFLLVSNSDIYFDSSLAEVQRMDFMDGKACQALLRWECSTRRLFGPRPDSQDVWVFEYSPGLPVVPHKYMKYFDFELGRPGCDNKVAYALDLMRMRVFNEPNRIRTWHLHSNPRRQYGLPPVRPPYATIEPQL